MKLKNWWMSEYRDTVLLLRSIPSLAVTSFVLSVVCMNLLANKELFQTEYLALDCGFTLSWFSFLSMDMICKRFGPKAALKVSVVALLINFFVFAIFNFLSFTPGHWGQYYNYIDVDKSRALSVDSALNETFGGSWYVVLGSALAMFVSSAVNAYVNQWVASKSLWNGFKGFALRSYVSTAIGQFIDNFVFAMVVSRIFFGWTSTQVVVCSITGALFELVCEVLMSPLGYKMCRNWEKNNIGNEYLTKEKV